MRASLVLLGAGIAGWAGLVLQPLQAGLPPTCGELSLWLLWQVTQLTADMKMVSGLAMWGVCMLLAMMAPGLFRPVDHIISQSLPRRTATLLLSFTFAYVVVWLPVVATLLLSSGVLLRSVGGGASVVLFGVACWYAWACTPMHQFALNRGHVMRPLRSFGGAAVRDAIALGARHGGWCILSCWPLMVIPLLSSGDSAPLMAACSAAGAFLRVLPPRAARWHLSGFLPLWAALVVTSRWCMRRLAMLPRRVLAAAQTAGRARARV